MGGARAALMADRLPKLAGRALTAYRVVWLVLLPTALVAAVADQQASWSPSRVVEAFALLGASTLLFRRRSADAIAAMIAIAFLLWVITASTAWTGMGSSTLPGLLDRVRFLLFVTAMMLFPTGRFDPGWTRFGVGAILLSFGIGIAEAVRLVPAGIHIPPTMACAALAVVAMRARLISLPPGVQRQQIKWVALGLGLGLLLVAISRIGGLALQSYTAPITRSFINGAFDFGVTLMALGVLTSLLRYRLYDADAAISRSSAIALLTLALIAIFAAAEVVIQAASQRLFGDMAGTVSSAIAAAIAAALIAPMHNWVAGWSERRFQPALVAFRKEMPDLLADLRETASLQALGETVLGRIERVARTSRAALLVGNEAVAARHVEVAEVGGALGSRNGNDALFIDEVPLELEGSGRVGRLLLGPRPDGSRLGKDDREAIEEIARPLARAIQAVQRNAARDAAGDRQAKRIADLVCRLSALERPTQATAQ